MRGRSTRARATLDHTYLYHAHHWRSAASHVALTRQRESTQVFVATNTACDAAQLARQMARGEVKAASVAWATGEEIATGALVSRVAALRALVSRPQARTTERLEAHAERAAQARQAGQERAARQQEIAAGVSRFRDRYADRCWQEAEPARDDQARPAVATWEDLIRAHAALPDIATDSGLKGTREHLIQFAHALDRTPEVPHALRTRGAEFSMETRPKLARMVADESAERAVTALLDWVEEWQRGA